MWIIIHGAIYDIDESIQLTTVLLILTIKNHNINK